MPTKEEYEPEYNWVTDKFLKNRKAPDELHQDADKREHEVKHLKEHEHPYWSKK